MDNQKPPVEIGEVLELQVTNFGIEGGDPILKHNGFVIFLKGSEVKPALHELIEVRVIRVTPKYAFAERVGK